MKNIPIDIKIKYQSIEWKKIAGMRDVLIHEYFGINFKIIWDIVNNKLPELKASLKKMIDDLK